jgi:hypothetical protein
VDLVNANFHFHWARRRLISLFPQEYNWRGMTIGSFNHGANGRGRNIGEAEMAEMTFPSSRESPFSPVFHQKAMIFISMFDSVSGQDFSYLGSCSLSIYAYVFRVRFSSFNGSFTPVLWWKKLVLSRPGTIGRAKGHTRSRACQRPHAERDR